jgi:aryl-alcohol dehydrogenase-like predicted oxidoreductase
MQLRQLGKSDLRITPIVFGAWAIGGWMWGGNEEADSIAAIQASLDHGVNCIDTAAIYGMGHSEELVAKAVAGRRDKVIIATKCGMRWDDPKAEGSDPWPQKDNSGNDVVIRKNAKPHSIAYEVEQSLKRLKTDLIDLYQIHWPDSTTPPEESIKQMEQLRQAGKVRAIGVSNYNVEWMQRATGVAPVASLQPPYSILRRDIEQDLLPWCKQHDVGVICYSPLERGLLTGKVTPDRTFAPGDHRAGHKYFSVENRKRVLAALETVRPIAERHKASLTQLFINWTAQQPGMTAAIVGARNAEQAAHNAGAFAFTLSAAEIAEIRAAFDETARQLNAAGTPGGGAR